MIKNAESAPRGGSAPVQVARGRGSQQAVRMGFSSDREIEESELGIAVRVDVAVCADCVADPGLAQFVASNLEHAECSFCGQSADNALAADGYDVVRFVAERLNEEWSRSVEVLFLDGEDPSGFAGPKYEIWDILEFEGPLGVHEGFDEFVASSFADLWWTPRGLYDLTMSEALKFGWDQFVEVVKYKQRFFFVIAPPSIVHEDDEPGYPVPEGTQLLQELGRLLRDYDLVRTLDAAGLLFRVRQHPVRMRYSSAKDLGAPPAAGASQSRMSPAGIPMFYAADDAATALEETVGIGGSRRKGITCATFRLREPCRIVDLSQLPQAPSIFDEDADATRRHELRFLNAFRRAVEGDVVRDGREHIDYVPTQVVCEYLRHHFGDSDEQPVHGLAWESTRNSGGRNVVLFIDRDRCVETSELAEASSGPLVELIAHEFQRLP